MLLLLAGRPLAARPESLARFGLDSVVAIDLFQWTEHRRSINIVVDITTWSAGGRLALYVRPWFRQPRTSEWDKEVYQAAIQYGL